MSYGEVHAVVLQGFEAIKLENFQYLQCHKDSTLVIFENQKLDGNGVISLAGFGSLYLHELSLPSSTSISIHPHP